MLLPCQAGAWWSGNAPTAAATAARSAGDPTWHQLPLGHQLRDGIGPPSRQRRHLLTLQPAQLLVLGPSAGLAQEQCEFYWSSCLWGSMGADRLGHRSPEPQFRSLVNERVLVARQTERLQVSRGQMQRKKARRSTRGKSQGEYCAKLQLWEHKTQWACAVGPSRDNPTPQVPASGSSLTTGWPSTTHGEHKTPVEYDSCTNTVSPCTGTPTNTHKERKGAPAG